MFKPKNTKAIKISLSAIAILVLFSLAIWGVYFYSSYTKNQLVLDYLRGGSALVLEKALIGNKSYQPTVEQTINNSSEKPSGEMVNMVTDYALGNKQGDMQWAQKIAEMGIQKRQSSGLDIDPQTRFENTNKLLDAALNPNSPAKDWAQKIVEQYNSDTGGLSDEQRKALREKLENAAKSEDKDVKDFAERILNKISPSSDKCIVPKIAQDEEKFSEEINKQLKERFPKETLKENIELAQKAAGDKVKRVVEKELKDSHAETFLKKGAYQVDSVKLVKPNIYTAGQFDYTDGEENKMQVSRDCVFSAYDAAKDPNNPSNKRDDESQKVPPVTRPGGVPPGGSGGSPGGSGGSGGGGNMLGQLAQNLFQALQPLLQGMGGGGGNGGGNQGGSQGSSPADSFLNSLASGSGLTEIINQLVSMIINQLFKTTENVI